MDLTENVECFVVMGSMLFSILILVIIDRIGTGRAPLEEEEE
ncbi:MAG TPA: hypothetical protein VFG99_11800 [Chloroflexia bacterium]|nr:hypothetical protein [Chloroflexia bacterium]